MGHIRGYGKLRTLSVKGHFKGYGKPSFQLRGTLGYQNGILPGVLKRYSLGQRPLKGTATQVTIIPLDFKLTAVALYVDIVDA